MNRRIYHETLSGLAGIIGGMLFLLGAALGAAEAGEAGDVVAVVYNAKLPESRQLAEYYAKRRNVPEAHLFGLDLPETETISRKEFQDKLQSPLLKKLEAARLLTLPPEPKRFRRGELNADKPPLPVSAKIRYLALCYGVPLRVASDPQISGDNAEALRPELRRNEAAVDSELALLPLQRFTIPLAGLVPNRSYGATNAALMHPTNGVLMVARLDGPSVEIARGLIDKAIQAEMEGCWGRAYFDARGLTNGPSKVGDDWIKGAAEITRRLGYETIVDQNDERFPASFPMSQIAFYAGWYEYSGHVSGPFTRPEVEFMPGAFAYHLHSFSAQTVRSATQQWVGPLLAKGATATLGCVFEPYLEFTPNLPILFHRFIHLGFSFGEAAYAAQPFLSWQVTVVGDPLYRPFAKPPKERHDELVQSKSKLIEWSQLKVVNINLATDMESAELIRYLEQLPELSGSAVLLEKLADLYLIKANFSDSLATYRRALERAESKQQQIRIMLRSGHLLEGIGRPEEQFEHYQTFTRRFPDYPDLVSIYRKLSSLADQLKRSDEKERIDKEIQP